MLTQDSLGKPAARTAPEAWRPQAKQEVPSRRLCVWCNLRVSKGGRESASHPITNIKKTTEEHVPVLQG